MLAPDTMPVGTYIDELIALDGNEAAGYHRVIIMEERVDGREEVAHHQDRYATDQDHDGADDEVG
jgi:hypothetical protein